MAWHTRHLTDNVTYWSATPDAFGGKIFTSPATLQGRWIEKSELFRNTEGQEVVSQAIVYLQDDIAVDDYLYHGISAASDPTLVDGAFPVRQFQKVPDLRNAKYERKAFL